MFSEQSGSCELHRGGHLTIVEPDERAVEAAAAPPHFMYSLAG
jgi:hypothetical protein